MPTLIIVKPDRLRSGKMQLSHDRSGIRTTRPKDNSTQDNMPHENLAIRQFAQDSEDNSPHFAILEYITLNSQMHATIILNCFNILLLIINCSILSHNSP